MAERRVWELVRLFLKLGFLGFGGPAAHIGMMHDEVVRRRSWLTEQHFLDLVGATNLVPGPNSTELAIHIGLERARWRGLLAAGVCFIGPAVLMVCAIAWAYVAYGQTPVGVGLLYGIKPVVIAIIGYAVASLARPALKTPLLAAVAVAGLCAYLIGLNELAILAAGGAVVAGTRSLRKWRSDRALAVWLSLPFFSDPTAGQLARLFFTMLKIGSVLYGSGYVLLAFLHGDFVQRLGWLTNEQLADAIAVGQVTPGPLFSTATFVGYLVAGWPGAIVATVGIFLPAFVFAALLGRIVSWIRAREWASGMLDGVNATALALMVGVAIQLGRESLVDPLTVVLAVGAALALWRWRLNSAWLVLAGAAVGGSGSAADIA